MSSGNNHKIIGLPADNTRLEQPSDAVPMENMVQGTTPAGDLQPAARVDASKESEIVATEPLPASKAIPTDPEQRSAENEDNTEAVSKGKEKEAVAPVPPTKERSDSIMAIGPAQDDIHTTPGHRHPYKIDAKYLTRRNVAMPDETESGQPDPFSISIYTLKELILREWRSDWEAKPASPSSIRLIHFGKLLDDKEQLKKYQFSTESPNVVHMSIRPQDLDEEEPKSGSKNLPGGSGDGQRSRPGGMCCVIL
ncbi:hypothetical protein J3458_001973 [Metarhizium acridum]|uniref:uncharacterized protein n=1 Tax=Metarhizium acridum TaxID=92637 RepID=UPI001C6BC6C6|nr:hypothetical protein J3458_001973 [Metarhizium acridum]